MEKHKCKLCFKSFANGRALGGHMRSHMLNLPIPPKLAEQQRLGLPRPANQLSEESESESASASYSSSSSEEEEGEEKGQFYGLRENPKRSVRLVDPEFIDAGSVVLQDREMSKTEPWAEPEPVSSISDATTEEDVAFCLMMLSRDQWKSKVLHLDDEEGTEIEKSTEQSYELQEYFKLSKVNRATRGKYKCETCNKVFKSYQALGGHRASHKKMKAYSPPATHDSELEPENVGTRPSSMTDKKIHECPVCFRVFSSGQALGGHKRSHVVATTETPVKSSKKLGDGFIDLNLPAPMDDDDASQIELSAVSDAEFVNHIK
ncbi:hypothetical protein GOBAR_DD23477 [Gossypium barbadense]|nr:hypothetical protein GOBAR_DD23477 [Gossypium barbadense]